MNAAADDRFAAVLGDERGINPAEHMTRDAADAQWHFGDRWEDMYALRDALLRADIETMNASAADAPDVIPETLTPNLDTGQAVYEQLSAALNRPDGPEPSGKLYQGLVYAAWALAATADTPARALGEFLNPVKHALESANVPLPPFMTASGT